jgi:hypothetical protein
MARFKYLGEKKQFKFVKAMGKVVEIRCRCKDGTVMKLKDPSGEFTPGQSICETMDPRSIRHMRADPRFQEIP